MKAADVTATLERALAASGLDKARVVHRPRLLSDNGSSYIADDLAKWLERHDMNHVRIPTSIVYGSVAVRHLDVAAAGAERTDYETWTERPPLIKP